MTQITIPNVSSEVEYSVTSASTGPFTVPFPFFDEDDVYATVTDALGVVTALTHSADFTFSSLDVPVDQEGAGYSGGTLDLSSSIGADGNTTLKIYRSTTIARTANYPNTGPFSMALLNDEQNKIVTMLQEMLVDISNWQFDSIDTVYAANIDSELATDGYALVADGIGGAAWEAQSGAGIANVVDDTSPQLGGNLDLNSSDINGTGNIDITGDIDIDGVAPQIEIRDTASAANRERWRLVAQSDALYLIAVSDDGLTTAGVFRIDRGAGTSISSLLMYAAINMADQELIRALLKDYSLVSTSPSSSSGVLNFAYTNGNVFEVELDENVSSVTFSGLPSSGSYAEILIKFTQDGTGSRTVTWPASVLWPGGTPPVITATASSGCDIVSLKTWDAGTTWYGDVSQDYS